MFLGKPGDSVITSSFEKSLITRFICVHSTHYKISVIAKLIYVQPEDLAISC